MADLLASGRLIDIILLIVAIEAVALGLYWRATGRGVAPRDLLPNLIAGSLLLVAMRLVIAEAAWPLVCAVLAGAGVASALDIARRWRS